MMAQTTLLVTRVSPCKFQLNPLIVCTHAWQTFTSSFTDLNHHQHTILTSLKNFDGGEKSPALVMALILVKINPSLYFHMFEIFGQCIM